MERTTCDVIRPPALEGNEITYDLDYLRRIENLVYGILRNHCLLLFLAVFHVLHISKRRRNIIVIIVTRAPAFPELDFVSLLGFLHPEH